MPVFKISGGAYQNIDESSLGLQSPALIDGYVDELNNTVKRPALKIWKDGTGSITTPIRGLFYWAAADKVIILANGTAFTLASDGTLTNATTSAIGTDNPAIFAAGKWSTTHRLFIASGGEIGYLADASDIPNNKMVKSSVSFTNLTPTAVTHVATINGWVICNSGAAAFKQTFYYSDDNLDPLVWTAGNLATAEMRPDEIVALHAFWNELYLFGSTICEIWHDDGVTPFSRIPGAIIHTGCSAPYTVIQAGGTVYWLDDRRRFVRLKGRVAQPVSNPFQKVFEGFTNIYDAIAYKMSWGGRNWIVLSFPSSGVDQSFIYDYDLDQWAEWGAWDTTDNVYTRFKGNCSTEITAAVTTATATANGETGSNDTDIGTRAWSNPTNIQGNPDDADVASVTNID